jgi:hypothetical protein
MMRGKEANKGLYCHLSKYIRSSGSTQVTHVTRILDTPHAQRWGGETSCESTFIVKHGLNDILCHLSRPWILLVKW